MSFSLISSLRYDPALPAAVSRLSVNAYPDSVDTPYYLLAYHRDRLITAAQHFQWEKALAWLQQDLRTLHQFLDASIPDPQKPWRLRIAVDDNGNGTVDVHPTAPIDPSNLLIPSIDTAPESSVWRVYVDTQATTPSGLTTHKTTSRDAYNAARLRAGIKSPADTTEVLVVNPGGEIMEGSITTPYFRRRDIGVSGPAWVTPPLDSGGNAGTTRRYALSQGFCVEQTISAAQLANGEECWLSNGVRGFIRGVVVRDR
ncbi:hypothetical protein N7510_000306 [Penicillium lagena]|uniref:uncharacterized protein n=1 Tax=Penicillium lagena TaxID=94218 RepID=UPI00253F81CA|nr:uncharacterized protein N7510_000306 [Penicillium lagena]KAJ5623997.1 hypothetical protein N7510_000306 [Penicillium lagena]